MKAFFSLSGSCSKDKEILKLFIVFQKWSAEWLFKLFDVTVTLMKDRWQKLQLLVLQLYKLESLINIFSRLKKKQMEMFSKLVYQIQRKLVSQYFILYFFLPTSLVVNVLFIFAKCIITVLKWHFYF